MRVLNLDILKEGLPGITKAAGNFLYEAALVALAKKGHSAGVTLQVSGEIKVEIQLVWRQELSENEISTWKENRDAANFGAIGIALLLMNQVVGFSSFEIGTQGTGIDYWMSKEKPDAGALHMINKEARVEISGILSETPSNTLKMRVKLKKKQITASDGTGLPGWVVAVEFGTPKTIIEKK